MANGWGGAMSVYLVAWSVGACGGVDLVVSVEVGEAHWIDSVDIRDGGIGVGCDCVGIVLHCGTLTLTFFNIHLIILTLILLHTILRCLLFTPTKSISNAITIICSLRVILF